MRIRARSLERYGDDSFALPAGERAHQTLRLLSSFAVVFRNCAGASPTLLGRNDVVISACETLTSEIRSASAVCQTDPEL